MRQGRRGHAAFALRLVVRYRERHGPLPAPKMGVRLWLADVESRVSFRERIPPTIHGYHRSLCMYSHMYRGTPDRPGLVLGLDRGGFCQGFAFMIADADWEETIAYLSAASR